MTRINGRICNNFFPGNFVCLHDIWLSNHLIHSTRKINQLLPEEKRKKKNTSIGIQYWIRKEKSGLNEKVV